MAALSLGFLLLCGLVTLAVLLMGGFLVLVKLGVIVREAGRPSFQDHSSYSLDQGREVRPEEERR